MPSHPTPAIIARINTAAVPTAVKAGLIGLLNQGGPDALRIGMTMLDGLYTGWKSEFEAIAAAGEAPDDVPGDTPGDPLWNVRPLPL